jgi:hypothetical protein
MKVPDIAFNPLGLTRAEPADGKTSASTQAICADLDDIEQMVILLHLMLERQLLGGPPG